MKFASYIGLVVGLAVLTGLIAWQGLMEVVGILLGSGWPLLLVPLIWLPTILMATRGWQLLFAPRHAPTFGQAFYAQWIGRSVNTLLPVATIGGEVVKARLLILWGIDPLHAGASAVVDKTVQVVALILWGAVGILALLWLALDDMLAVAATAGLALLGAGVAGFFVVQRSGMFGFMARFAHKLTQQDYFSGLIEKASEVDRIIRAVYRQRSRTAAATLWRFLAVVLQTGEVWLAAHLLGHPIGLVEAVMLKSLSGTLSDVAFVVPNSYGIQEGAYVVLGALVGLAPDVALAVSLATRLRELLFDVPGLLFWQHAEGRALIRRRRSGNPT
jgi:putative membrane protein